jgi:hypothetical protein
MVERWVYRATRFLYLRMDGKSGWVFHVYTTLDPYMNTFGTFCTVLYTFLDGCTLYPTSPYPRSRPVSTAPRRAGQGRDAY